MWPMAGSRIQTHLERRVKSRMTLEEGSGKEAGGSTPAGASVHPSAMKAKPIERRILCGGQSRIAEKCHAPREWAYGKGAKHEHHPTGQHRRSTGRVACCREPNGAKPRYTAAEHPKPKCRWQAFNMTMTDTSRGDRFQGAQTMSNQQGLVWHRWPLGSGSVGASYTVPWLVLSIKSERERTGIMLYVLHSPYGFDFGPARALGWPAEYCGIRPRPRHWDDQLRDHHGNDTSTFGTSICRSP